MNPLIEYKNPPVALPITREQLLELGYTDAQIESGECRGEMKTFGYWQIPVSYRTLCASFESDNSRGYTIRLSKKIYGFRTLRDIRQLGYKIEGRVSLVGKKLRGFSSSLMFELPDKKLFNVAVIYV